MTLRVKVSRALGEKPFLATRGRRYCLPVMAAGMPESVAVPLPLLWKVTPAGRAPVLVMFPSGKPVVEIVAKPVVPTEKVAMLVPVNFGGSLTVRVKDCLNLAPMPLPARSLMV